MRLVSGSKAELVKGITIAEGAAFGKPRQRTAPFPNQQRVLTLTASDSKATSKTKDGKKSPVKKAAKKVAQKAAKPAKKKPEKKAPEKKAPEKKAPARTRRATPRQRPDFALEDALGAEQGRTIVGIDEAGRGPWAGPVVAAAVWMHRMNFPKDIARRLDDSKKLSEATRQALYIEIVQNARIGLGQATVEEIDRLNILRASLLAMERAVAALGLVPDAALVDGNKLPANLPCPAQAVVQGDSRSLSIAAASVIAKVSRDRIMTDLARDHPGYGWERNRGYGTAEHMEALRKQGVSPQHRRSFRPVREILQLSS